MCACALLLLHKRTRTPLEGHTVAALTIPLYSLMAEQCKRFIGLALAMVVLLTDWLGCLQLVSHSSHVVNQGLGIFMALHGQQEAHDLRSAPGTGHAPM